MSHRTTSKPAHGTYRVLGHDIDDWVSGRVRPRDAAEASAVDDAIASHARHVAMTRRVEQVQRQTGRAALRLDVPRSVASALTTRLLRLGFGRGDSTTANPKKGPK